MKLDSILKFVRYDKIIGSSDIEINGLCTDSRKVTAGDLFFCYRGGKFDSHESIAEINDGGAVAVVCERELETDLTQIIVKDGRAQIARVAQAFYGFADKKLKIIGVTGTNGKTTTTYMLDSIFRAAGKKTGIIGTLGIIYDGRFISPELTTPDPIYMHRVLADMVNCGVEWVFMEVSAHALYFDKIYGLNFEVGILTNCTQDHLDFFKDMGQYAESKKLLFKNGRCNYAVLNSDDSLGAELCEKMRNAVSFGLLNPADVFAIDINERIDGTTFVINLFDELYEITLKLPARHNVYNAMGAAAAAKLAGIRTEAVAQGLKNLDKVPGRLEHAATYNGGEIFVDFAHTPDGLEKSLQALKSLCKGKLYCLFGCGGNRDRTKRPIMGEVAAKYADYLIITSDNPRYEDPYDIITEIEKGVKDSGVDYVTVTERDTATEYAIRLLEEGDILLVAGKGGEHYQEIMGIKHSYDDNTVIKKIIG